MSLLSDFLSCLSFDRDLLLPPSLCLSLDLDLDLLLLSLDRDLLFRSCLVLESDLDRPLESLLSLNLLSPRADDDRESRSLELDLFLSDLFLSNSFLFRSSSPLPGMGLSSQAFLLLL